MYIKGAFLALFALGLFVLMQVLSPVMAFKIWEITAYDSLQLLADPLSPSGQSGGGVLGVSISTVNDFPAFISTQFFTAPYNEFDLTIPKLKLEKVKVKVASNDFNKNLAHLGGTALPGEKGNVFISGHSSVSREIALKDSKAYFSRLQNVKKDDQIFVEALGQKYVYTVVGTRIVDPKNIEVINAPDDEGRYLTLMTCVPPGFNTKRLIVLAKLQQI